MPRWRRSPRPLSVALDGARDRWAPETVLAEVQRIWPEAVGSAIAVEARPVSERGGVLTVSCSAILERLNPELRSGRINRLRCVAVPPDDDRFR
jgi:predicted nucleic acid-binding Zn ribbon protein